MSSRLVNGIAAVCRDVNTSAMAGGLRAGRYEARRKTGGMRNMIFHFSIAADDPKSTATMLAELWRGEAFYFPMVGEGSWVAHAGDDRRSTIEVYPRGLALYPSADGQGDQRSEAVSRHGPFHAAVA